MFSNSDQIILKYHDPGMNKKVFKLTSKYADFLLFLVIVTIATNFNSQLMKRHILSFCQLKQHFNFFPFKTFSKKKN